MNSNPESTADQPEELGPFERLGKRLDGMPPFRLIDDAVRRAKEEVEKAAAYCKKLRDKTINEAGEVIDEVKEGIREEVKERNIGDLAGDTIRYIKRHPVQAAVASALVGFVMGRFGRRG